MFSLIERSGPEYIIVCEKKSDVYWTVALSVQELWSILIFNSLYVLKYNRRDYKSRFSRVSLFRKIRFHKFPLPCNIFFFLSRTCITVHPINVRKNDNSIRDSRSRSREKHDGNDDLSKREIIHIVRRKTAALRFLGMRFSVYERSHDFYRGCRQ